jgi:2-methylcitrate dehydratase PrpD
MSFTVDVAPASGAAIARNNALGPTRELAQYVIGISFEDLPSKVVDKAKNLLLDHYGCLVTTTNEPMAKILFTVASTEGAAAVLEKSGTIAGLAGRYTTEWTAFVNGANTHLSELDDTHRLTAAHSGLGLFATALAIAERTHPTGKEFITAVVAGYEVALRIALSVNPNHYIRGWNPSGTATMFGCAAVAAKLLGLDAEHTAWAIGLAGVQVAGNRAHLTERVMTKDFNNGHAARCGVSAGLLAQAGFTASTDELENAMGFWALYGAGTVNPEEATLGLGSLWHILEVGHKPYPSCRFIHSSLDAIIGLIDEGLINVADVAGITATMSATGRYIVDDPEPWTEGKGTMGPRFSAQFNIAVAALYGRAGLEDIYDPDVAQEYLARADVRRLMTLIYVKSDQSIDQNPDDFWKGDIEVCLSNGNVERRVVRYPLGEPENDLGTDGLVARFIKMTTMAGFWDMAQAERVASELLHVDEIPDAGVLPSYYA